ncbi:MAG TPA: haloacid dehalogenase [Chloroflexota bacterium]|nr:haloacid dehalogenase [Chloroflexota bacterium]
MAARIDEIVAGLAELLEAKSAARDKALLDARQLTRRAALAIRALHRGHLEQAQALLSEGESIIARMAQDLARYPDLYWSGYVLDAQKEFCEASVVATLIADQPVPGPEDLGVEIVPFLNGLAEAASEMRRYVLDIIRHGSVEHQQEGERVLDQMDSIYTALITVDFPDALTGGLRRTTDVVRGVLERTRGDLTMSLRQAQLERALRDR